jgi:hypothetical protein
MILILISVMITLMSVKRHSNSEDHTHGRGSDTHECEKDTFECYVP